MDERSSTAYHPWPNRWFNLRSKLANAFGSARIDLSERDLLSSARALTGLDDFGDDSFLTGLRVLLSALESEACLNPFGRRHARTKILGSLANRLWANACFSAHPEIRARRIAAPIVIVGPHRSGTTRLHRMLSADSRLQHLTTWEGFNPAPRSLTGDRRAERAARRAEIDAALQIAPRFYPGAFVGHPMHADWAEEEMLLLNHAFCSFAFFGEFVVPSYYRWYVDCDRSAAYRDMADFLRLVAWSRGVPEDTPWVLKDPQHLLDLDALLRVFPDARLVFCHRDPLKTVASVISLMWHFAVQHTDAPIRAGIRDIWLDFCVRAAQRGIKARERIAPDQQMDVGYEAMNRDWRAVLHDVYRHAGIEFTSDAERSLGAWLERSEAENRHGGHRYALEDFGLTVEAVDARMKFVRERYAIPYERR